MNLIALQQTGHILTRLLNEAARMGNTTMTVTVPELKLFQDTTNCLWAELNQERMKKSIPQEDQDPYVQYQLMKELILRQKALVAPAIDPPVEPFHLKP